MSDQHSLSSDQVDNAVHKWWSQEDLQQQTRNFMVMVYGRPTEQASMQDKVDWYERYGLLTDFIAQLWKGTEP